ncbi:phosphatase PAP2 family protein [Nocardia sp. AG03]|uniref:phosphatase PAP2 family protein n=1 Tax=Nocardia sp. AG03 TaxID=3025312 RepID=UPI002418271C|nr:phosphatase PAP2 family protein [Nocardia sp. AG03]
MPIASRRPPPDEIAWSALGRRVPLTAVLVAAAAIVVAVLTWQVDSGAAVTRLDARVLDWMIAHRGEPLTSIARVITDLGDTLSMTVLATVTVCLFLWQRHWACAALVAITSLGAGLLVVVIKQLVGRNRPPELTRMVYEPSLSYPSGHTLGSTVVVGIVAITLIPRLRRRWARVGATVLAVLFPIAVGLSRVYLGVHWLSDVLAGWTIGLIWLAVCVTVFTVVRVQRAPVTPPVPAPAER